MAGISGLTNNNFYGTSTGSVGTLFSSLKTNSTSAMSSVLSDYASIKNGSYGKLMKTYYGQNTVKSADQGSKVTEKAKKSTSVDTDTKKALSDVKSEASALKSASEKLSTTGKDNLFVKKDIKAEDGSVKNDYDRDAIYSAVSDFAKNYNDTVDAADKTNNLTTSSISSNISSMTNTMKNALSKVGVSVDTQGKMTVDEDKLKASDMKDVKALFNGPASYGAQIGKYAGQMASSATNALTSLTGSAYSGSGSYASDMLSGTSFNSYF